MFRIVIVLVLLPFWGIAQQATIVDFLRIEASVTPHIAEKSIDGNMSVTFKMLQPSDSVFLDAKDITISETPENKGVTVSVTPKTIVFHHQNTFQKDRIYTVNFQYQATPKQALYFTATQVWTQEQGKYTSHWLPSLDDMNDKIEFDLEIAASGEQMVVANGRLDKFTLYDDKIAWHYDMKKPMSSYLVAFALGDFKIQKVNSNSEVPIELYISKKDSLKWEPTYRYSKEIFNFLETEIGIPYPWQNYKQVPVSDFLYAGMENTGCTLFSEAFVVDSIGFKDRNYVNVNAHELAHQWFGNLVTETEGTHHWLHEGFATYYALLAERQIFGEDYYYWKLYNSAEQLMALSDQGKGQKLLDPNASSLVFYEKGAWALHILRELVGDTAYHEGVRNYLKKYAFGNVTTEDFLKEMQQVTEIDLSEWKVNWLQQTAFKSEEAYQSLRKSDFMNRFFETVALRNQELSNKKFLLRSAIQSQNDFIGQEAVYQLAQEPFYEVEDLYALALQTNNIFIRQAVALSLQEVPKTFQSSYETLLEDASYVTQEAALYTLWVHFPEKRTTYLNRLEGMIGFQDKNLRQLWLALALYTEGYKTSDKLEMLKELLSYSEASYSFEVRQKALDYLYSMGIDNEQFVKNLVNACTHHYWRFRDAARKLLDEFIETEANKEKVLGLFSSYSEAEKAYIQRKFKMQ